MDWIRALRNRCERMRLIRAFIEWLIGVFRPSKAPKVKDFRIKHD